MKTWKFLPIMAIGVCMAMTSCSEDSKRRCFTKSICGFNTPDSGTATDDELKAAVATYVDDVVIPTYQDMYNKVTALNTAVQKLSTSSSDNDVANAADAWVAARKPWEKVKLFYMVRQI